MIIALVGRPNVGKSSLFNRMIGRRQALVWDRAGVTRDLIRGEWSTERGKIEVWDLAGWGKFGLSFKNLSDELKADIDLILFIVDGSTTITSDDREALKQIRRSGKPFLTVLNKCDKASFKENRDEVLRLGIKDFVEISAEQKKGIGELEDAVLATKAAQNVSTKEKSEEEASKDRKVLILGRPNVGKSSLINALAEQDISFVADEAGTTRDLISHSVDYGDKKWIFVDSAGVRKKSKLYGRKGDEIEIFSAEKALKALDSVDICLFVVEASEDGRLKVQDRKLLRLVKQAMIPTLVVVNKWDLVRKTWDEKDYRNELRYDLVDLEFVPVLFASAKTGFHIAKIFQILKALDQSIVKISTSALNKWLQATMARKAPKVAKRGVTNDHFRTRTQYLQIQYVVQIQTKPMTFQFFCNAPHAVAEDDKRFFTRALREHFKLQGLPVRMLFRKKN